MATQLNVRVLHVEHMHAMFSYTVHVRVPLLFSFVVRVGAF